MQNKSIAVVEDDYTKKNQLKGLLTKAGYKVTSFSASPKLINQLVASDPAIIITDKDPANPKDPFWVFREVKKQAKLKKAEIFAYLKEIEVEDEIRLRKLKVTSYFTKRNKISYVIQGVRKHFDYISQGEAIDPWEEHLKKVEQQQAGFVPYPYPSPHGQTPPGYQPPPPGYHPPPPGHQPPPQAPPQKAPAAPPAASPAQQPARKPLIPAGRQAEQSPPTISGPDADFSDFLTTIQDAVVDKGPSKPEASPAVGNFNNGIKFYNNEQYPQALIMFEKSRMDKNYQVRSLIMIGKIHRHMNNMNAAIATFKEAHHASVENEHKLESRYEIAKTMKIQGKLQDAYNMFATVYKADKAYKDVRQILLELKSKMK